MKITKTQLKQIIKEELEAITRQSSGASPVDRLNDVLDDMTNGFETTSRFSIEEVAEKMNMDAYDLVSLMTSGEFFEDDLHYYVGLEKVEDLQIIVAEDGPMNI